MSRDAQSVDIAYILHILWMLDCYIVAKIADKIAHRNDRPAFRPRLGGKQK